jgi:hypothetical protein
LIEYDAEDSHLTSVMMYMPQYIWLLPLFVLVPLSLIWMRLIVIQAIVAVYVLFFFMDYVTAGPQTAGGVTIKVLTSNTGQHHGKTIQEFGERNDPDIVVLQDAARRGPEYTNMFPTLHARGHDQFLVLSKYEIEDGGIMPDLVDEKDRPVAAWFKLKVGGQGLYLFAVHMPTPRDQLQAAKGFGILGSVAHRVKKGGHAAKVYTDAQVFFKHQLELAESSWPAQAKRICHSSSPVISTSPPTDAPTTPTNARGARPSQRPEAGMVTLFRVMQRRDRSTYGLG